MTDSSYARVRASYEGIPGVEHSRAATVEDVLPMVGVQTTSLKLIRQNEYDGDDRITGAKFVAFVQQIHDHGAGPVAVQVVLGDRAVRTLIRQYEALTSRKRAHARERASERALAKPAGFARKST